MYTEFIHEYAELGHLTEIDTKNIGDTYFYLPHHPVIREKSETTRLRTVFDASAKSTSGLSINDLQMTGPNIQDSLFSILIRFRQYKYALSGDIEKMYRAVSLHQSDRDLQLILWRDSEDKPLQTLQLNTVTYGFSSASFLSTRCLWQVGEECENKFIKNIIQHDFYVDDLLTGSDSEKELSDIKDSVSEALAKADEGIEFRFSPAYAPHFGGLWEAGVKSAKFHISRILGKTHLTYEELSSLFTQVEAILNSRPLCPLSPSPDDYSPLTPAHFLIGRPFTSLPAPCLLEHNTNRLDRYERLEQYKQHFWQRWTKEYICELQQRTKWRVKCKDLQLNDLVLLKDDSPPLNWRLGRIEKLFPGSDGIPRVAEVATSRGIVRRALNKICLLPTPEDTTDS
ncbi:unnamed protein product [Plutella xylostella]|uniref:(diamondback moth) hypothetical protein n=1 Tax=Plutella xylostella TaxID=51655 RepID=A0A8S4FSC5_PLUXY|nr:unnamed protein product [Plutella xylostella]CAG9134221.1 unnamed protein product [Plutella xylostella]